MCKQRDLSVFFRKRAYMQRFLDDFRFENALFIDRIYIERGYTPYKR